MAAKLAIQMHGVSKHYRLGMRDKWRKVLAVHALDLAVREGSVTGLLGPNGAGKTTTIHMALGLTKPSSGDIHLFGESVRSHTARQEIGYVPEKFELPPFLSAREFLNLHAKLAGVPLDQQRREVDRCLERMSLATRADDIVSTFSKGMQQRLAIAQALLGTPRMIIFDEPTSALDPIGRRDVRDLVLELRAAGATVLFNSHLLSEVEQVCDEVVILDRGQLVSQHQVRAQDTKQQVSISLRIAGLSTQLREQLGSLVAALQVTEDNLDQSGSTSHLAGVIRDEEIAADIAELVVQSGARLLSLSTNQESLESLFMRAVGVESEV